MKIQLLNHDLIDEAHGIVVAVTNWLIAKQINQWDKPLPKHILSKWSANGFVYGAFDGEKLIAVFAMRRNDLSEYEIRQDPPVAWLSTVCVQRTYAHQGVGQLILDYAKCTHPEGIYLDCADNAGFLPDYYRSHGFTEVKRMALYKKVMVLMEWRNNSAAGAAYGAPQLLRSADMKHEHDQNMSTDFRPTPRFAARLNKGIVTKRLFLEPLLASHADALFQALSDGRIYKWIEAGGPRGLNQLRLKWKECESRISPNGKAVLLNWAIRISNEGPYVGKIDVQLDSATNADNVGLLLFPNYWGLGYATESVGAVISWLLENGIQTMLATVSVPNVASSRVLEKIGFIRGKLSTLEKDTYEYNLVVPCAYGSGVQQDNAPDAFSAGSL